MGRRICEYVELTFSEDFVSVAGVGEVHPPTFATLCLRGLRIGLRGS